MKKCVSCHADKPLNCFTKRSNQKDGLDYYCKDCSREKSNAYRERNKEKIKERKKAEYEKNKEHYSAYKKEWKKKNRDRLREQKKKFRHENPIAAFISSFRGRTNKLLSHKKNGKPRTMDFVGCSTDILRQHIESQFKKGMSWDNYGEWHIDHIIPLQCAIDMDEVFTLCHYTNLQPLWAKDNLSKSSKMPDDLIELGLVDLESGEFTPAPPAEAEVVE